MKKVEPISPESEFGRSEGGIDSDGVEVMGIDGDAEEGDEEENVEGKCGECYGGGEVERVAGTRDDRRVRGIGDPRKPTAKEVEAHNLSHLPYRN